MTTGTESLESLVKLALRVAKAAGDDLLRRFGEDSRSSVKGHPSDLVSEGDLSAERIISEGLIAARPKDGILSEERERRQSRSGFTWIIDPLDSTANYLRGIPVWSVSVACEFDGEPLAAAVVAPALRESFAGGRGVALEIEGVQRSIPPAQRLDQAAMVVGLGRARVADSSRAGQVADALFPRLGKVRSPGSPALGLAWTAAGRFDAAYYEMAFGPWDVAAGMLLCRQAGLAVFEAPPAADGLDPRVLVARDNLVADLSRLLRGLGGNRAQGVTE